jgi:hypothetical protein
MLNQSIRLKRRRWMSAQAPASPLRDGGETAGAGAHAGGSGNDITCNARGPLGPPTRSQREPRGRRRGPRMDAAAESAGRTRKPFGSVGGRRQVVLEQERRGIGSQREWAEVETTPCVNARRCLGCCQRSVGVSRASNAVTGNRGGTGLGRSGSPLFRKHPNGIQLIETGRQGMHGVGLHRYEVATTGPRRRRRKPGEACEQQSCDKPAEPGIASDFRRHLGSDPRVCLARTALSTIQRQPSL